MHKKNCKQPPQLGDNKELTKTESCYRSKVESILDDKRLAWEVVKAWAKKYKYAVIS
jgi:hypothetical protein